MNIVIGQLSGCSYDIKTEMHMGESKLGGKKLLRTKTSFITVFKKSYQLQVRILVQSSLCPSASLLLLPKNSAAPSPAKYPWKHSETRAATEAVAEPFWSGQEPCKKCSVNVYIFVSSCVSITRQRALVMQSVQRKSFKHAQLSNNK